MVFVAACSSKPSQPVTLVRPQSEGRTLGRNETAALRHPEILKAYPLGRYVDPNSRKVMHEAHTVYRVESTSKWNLAKRADTKARETAPSSPAPELSRNELLVELNRQREATKAVMQSGQP